MRAAISLAALALLTACGDEHERERMLVPIEPERAPAKIPEADPPAPEPVAVPPPPPEVLQPAGRVPEGPLADTAEEAAMAGIVDEDSVYEIDATLPYQRDIFVLARKLEHEATRHEPARWSIYLLRVRPAGEEEFQRLSGALLYDFAVAGEEDDCDEAPLEMSSELRARDLDGDGEVEITVIAAAAAIPARTRSYNPQQECGLVAFLVGANDLDVQARFSRRHNVTQINAGGELYSRLDTTWRLEDVNGDGRDDLRVTEAYRYSFDFMGDDIGGGEVAPAEHERRANRRTVDCPYDVASDRWACPTTPRLGASLFRDRAVLLQGGRAEIPDW